MADHDDKPNDSVCQYCFTENCQPEPSVRFLKSGSGALTALPKGSVGQGPFHSTLWQAFRERPWFGAPLFWGWQIPLWPFRCGKSLQRFGSAWLVLPWEIGDG
jgi:hypothetical protein